MSKFEDDLMNSVKCAMVNQINKTDFIQIPYDQRKKIPDHFIERAWELVDHSELCKKLSQRLESELVDRIVNHMASEIATDIKQVLSVKERREKIRSLVRENIEELTAK